MSQIEKSDPMNIGAMCNLHRWRMIFFGAIILLAGMVTGGALMMILMPHKLMTPPPGPEFDSLRMLPSLRRDLGLTPEQSRRISPILDQHMKKLGEIRTEARTEIEQTLKQMNEDICEILTDRQERIWKQSVERLQRGLRPGGGPGRLGEGPGGGRQRRGQQERRGPGPYGPPQRQRGPNVPQDTMNSDTNHTEEKPIEDSNQIK
ncbi:MAG: hypothetical protein JXM79_04385 [Sedimentisphaerales bacterium]|nr:hypothetical protein [Sedimentisphaerales bacterium]